MAVHTRWRNSWVRDRFERLRERLADERGLSLVLALIVVSALSITTAALAELIQSNEHAFGRDRQEERAFNIAEAGINYGVSHLTTLSSSSYAVGSSIGTGPSSNTYSLDNGTGGWWAEKTASDKWTIYSQSTVAGVSRKVSVQLSAPTTSTNTAPSLVWGYGFFVADPNGCTNMVGTSTMTISVFIAGELCLSGTQQIEEPNAAGQQKVTVYVAKHLYMTNNTHIGTTTRHVISVTALQGCIKGSYPNGSAVTCSNSAQSHVYADSYPNTTSTLTKPTIDPDGTYASGDWNHPVCSTGSFTFDNNGTRNTSVGTVDILTASSYTCTVYKDNNHVAGNEEGTLSWNAATKVLNISGIIYIDGNLQFAGGDQATYTGFGALYVDGTVTTNGNSAFCGPGATVNGSSCNGLWDATQGAIFIMAVNHNSVVPAWQMNGNAEFNVGLYIVGTFAESGTAKVTGPVVTDKATVSGTADQTDVTNPPPGVPGAGGSSTTSSWGNVIKGTWQQLPTG